MICLVEISETRGAPRGSRIKKGKFIHHEDMRGDLARVVQSKGYVHACNTLISVVRWPNPRCRA